MSRGATLSILGLYEWDNTIFDLMALPAGVDRNTLRDNLLAETAELEVLFPNPVVMKNLIGVWSKKQIDIWNRLFDTTKYEYNPIENYNRYEEGTTAGTGKTTHSGTDTTNENNTHTGTDAIKKSSEEGGTQRDNYSGSVTNSGSDTVTGNDTKSHWVAGFDAPTPTPSEDGLFKQTKDLDDASTVTDYGKVETSTGNNTTTFGKTDDSTENINYNTRQNKTGSYTHGEQIDTSENGSHNLHIHGNIGVMSTQTMIQQEREIDLFNIYDIIIQDFKMRFCILVY